VKPGRTTVRLLWILVGFLSLIGVAIVIRRALALAGPAPAPGAMDAAFWWYKPLTIIHIVPGLLFIIVGPLQFMSGLRRRHLALHRWLGRLFVASGLIVGTTAILMAPRMAIGGANETAATLFFAAIFLVALVKAYIHIRRRNIVLHRQWMIRAYAVGLAVTTIRPIIGMFFATAPLTHLTPHDFFGIAFWIGFTLHLIAAEIWIDCVQKTQF
jgi:uncharacterized membrane protein